MTEKITIDMVDIKKPLPMDGTKIKNFRRKKKLSQNQLAKILNVSIKTVQAWEQNVNPLGGSALRLFSLFKRFPDIFEKLAVRCQ